MSRVNIYQNCAGFSLHTVFTPLETDGFLKMDEQKQGILMRIDKQTTGKVKLNDLIDDVIMLDLAERFSKLSIKSDD